MRPAWSLQGISSTAGLKKFFEQYIPIGTRIEELPLPMAIVATDIKNHSPHYFTKGNLWTALCASIAIPILFTPAKQGQHIFVDGKLSDPVPITIAKKSCKNTIAVYASIHKHSQPLSALEKKALTSLGQATIPIHPDISGFDAFAYQRFDELVALGYCAAKKSYLETRQKAHSFAIN